MMAVSRDYFNESLNFTEPQWQEGVPVLDADLNLACRMGKVWLRRSIAELMGNGTSNAGFMLSGNITNPVMGAGDIFIIGWRVFIPESITASSQPNHQSFPAGDGIWYLDVYEKLVTSAEEPILRDTRLPGDIETPIKAYKLDWTLKKVSGSNLPSAAGAHAHIALALETSGVFTDMRNAGMVSAGPDTGFQTASGGHLGSGHKHLDEEIIVDSPEFNGDDLEAVLDEIGLRLDVIEGGGAPPASHAMTHENGGADMIALGSLNGSLSVGQHGDRSSDAGTMHGANQISGLSIPRFSQLTLDGVNALYNGAQASPVNGDIMYLKGEITYAGVLGLLTCYSGKALLSRSSNLSPSGVYKGTLDQGAEISGSHHYVFRAAIERTSSSPNPARTLNYLAEDVKAWPAGGAAFCCATDLDPDDDQHACFHARNIFTVTTGSVNYGKQNTSVTRGGMALSRMAIDGYFLSDALTDWLANDWESDLATGAGSSFLAVPGACTLDRINSDFSENGAKLVNFSSRFASNFAGASNSGQLCNYFASVGSDTSKADNLQFAEAFTANLHLNNTFWNNAEYQCFRGTMLSDGHGSLFVLDGGIGGAGGAGTAALVNGSVNIAAVACHGARATITNTSAGGYAYGGYYSVTSQAWAYGFRGDVTSAANNAICDVYGLSVTATGNSKPTNAYNLAGGSFNHAPAADSNAFADIRLLTSTMSISGGMLIIKSQNNAKAYKINLAKLESWCNGVDADRDFVDSVAIV